MKPRKSAASLTDAQKALLFPILARLIRRGELGGATRRMAQRDEFDAGKQRLIAHLSSEEGGRLLLAGDASVEIAHEALITRWPWLRTEGQKYASDIEELSRLMEKAKAWAKEPVSNRPKYLATGAELETFSALAERRNDWLSNKECEFVDASKKAHEAEEKRKADDARLVEESGIRRVSACSPAICGDRLAGCSSQSDGLCIKRTRRPRTAHDEAQQNLREARRNFLSALTALAFAEWNGGLETAAKLGLAAWPRPGAMDMPKRDVTTNAVSRSLAGLHVRMRVATDSIIIAVAFSPDGETVLTGSNDNTARLWDAETGKEIRAFGNMRGLPSPSAPMAAC